MKTPTSTVLDIKKMFNDYVASHQKVWDHDRSSTVGASEVFACLRQGWFKKFGTLKGLKEDPKDEENGWGAMERGNVMEEHWVVPVLEDQIPKTSKYLYGSEGQTTFVYGQNSATPDGLITNLAPDALSLYGIEDIESDCICVEIKSFDPRSSFEEEKAVHHGQAQQQMGIIRRMTDYKPMYTIIVYVNASFYDDIRVFPVRYDPGSWKSAQMRADEILNADDPSTLRPEGKLTDGCKFCTWQNECAKASKENVPTKEVKAVNIPEDERHILKKLVEEEREFAQAEKDNKLWKEEARLKIKDLLMDFSTKSVKDKELGYSVTWTWQDGKKTLDTDAMKEAGIDLEPFYNTGNGFERMTIKLQNEE